jgi:spore coat polysaccharide biosynthesis protein SpsF
MRAATVITARLGSSRLPRKMLADLGGATALERLVKRVSTAKRPDVMVLATTQEPEDDELTAAAEALGLSVFRGSTHDVLVRWRDAATTYGADLLVNCDGDDVFCDAPHIDRIVETYEQTGAEYIVCAGLPFGAAPTGIAASGLERICERKLEDNTEGQGRFFAVPGIVSKAEVTAPAELGHPTARMTLDYPEDLEFFSAVLAELGAGPGDEPPPLEQIVAVLRARPDILAINSGVQERYWQRFNALYQPVQLGSA